MHVPQRLLPHLHIIGQPLFVTFRLYGSLPPGRDFPKESMTSGKAFVCMDRLLDKHRLGPHYLRAPAIAQCVVDAIRATSLNNFLLHAWVIMPNHVHLLITPSTEVPKLLRELKGSSARSANQILGRTGTPFWQRESYDRLVRNPTEFDRITNYIIQNPVQARLAVSPEAYRWSSAFQGGGLKPTAG